MNLPLSRYARIDRLFRIGEQIWDARPDVRKAHGDAESWGFWCWMMFSGAGEYEELRSAFYPLPDSYLTERVVGTMPLQDFVRDGVVDCNRIYQCLLRAGFDFKKKAKVLDFGCGCGRLLRVMARFADNLEIHGGDVDPDAIRFCRDAFDFAEFADLPTIPPCSYGTGQFDVICAYSVFTHLPEKVHLKWIEELARITAPGALVVLTTGGHRLVEHWLAGRPDPVPTPAELRLRLPEFEERGFLFFPYEKLEISDPQNESFFGEWDLSQYGMTFILEDYIHRHWLDSFQLVSFEAAPDDWQDFVVLRRRG